MTTTFYSAFQAHHKMKLVSALMLFNDIGTSVAIIVLIIQGYGLFAILWGTLLISMVNFLITWIAARKILGYFWSGRADKNLWRYLFKESYPIALSSVGVTMYLYLSSSLLKYLKGDELMGYYGAALKLIIIMSLIPAAFTQVMYPIFSELFAAGNEKLRSMLEISIRYILIISVPLSIGAILIADKLIVTVYSESFRPSIVTFQILMISNLLSYPNWLLYSFLSAIKKQRFQMYATLSTGIAIVLINYFFIPLYGLYVPSISLVGVEVILFIGALMYLTKTGYHLVPQTLLVKPVAAGLVMAVAVIATSSLPMSVQILIGGIAFITSFLFMGGLQPEDKKIFQNIFPDLIKGNNGN
jgi:O-antigen/teichoic acid export membrane protein